MLKPTQEAENKKEKEKKKKPIIQKKKKKDSKNKYQFWSRLCISELNIEPSSLQCS